MITRNISRNEYAFLRHSYRAAARLLTKEPTAFARCVQLNHEVRVRTNNWYTGLGDRPTSRHLVHSAGGEHIRLNGRSYIRFGASRSLTKFLAP
jgi:hypothetical protein